MSQRILRKNEIKRKVESVEKNWKSVPIFFIIYIFDEI